MPLAAVASKYTPTALAWLYALTAVAWMALETVAWMWRAKHLLR